MKKTYYHFLRTDRKLGYKDGRLVIPGETYKIEGKPILCRHGLHASSCIIDALKYAPGPILCKVNLTGDVIHSVDKSVATERTVLAMLDATEILCHFARLCALDVIHLWSPLRCCCRILKNRR